MRKHLNVALTVLLFMVACQKTSSPDRSMATAAEETATITQRTCGANEVLQAQLAADPSLRERMNQIEQFTQRFVADKNKARLVNGSIVIPVVVNVVYRTSAENISDAQIQSQIDVLNEDYSNTNADKSQIPSEFKSVDGTVGIKFELALVVRKQTRTKSWSTNDAVKSTARGGQDPTDPAHNLNMWACNLGQSLLGYAQFPGGNPATDGVVILYSAFGSRSKYPGGTYISTYDKGRTATHEVGHWMNLRHIWGDATCGSDQVNDTPPHHAANYGCPGVINITCTNNATTNPYGFTREMTMNYMDYTDDGCMYMFTGGQKDRIMAVFAQGGPRYSFAQ